jgi:hypothetical protein
VTLRDGERVIGRSGAMGEEGDVDPWAHFVNAYLLDREGNRIDRRNVQDIFVALYDHQIPPGSAALVQYALHGTRGCPRPPEHRGGLALPEVRHRD